MHSGWWRQRNEPLHHTARCRCQPHPLPPQSSHTTEKRKERGQRSTGLIKCCLKLHVILENHHTKNLHGNPLWLRRLPLTLGLGAPPDPGTRGSPWPWDSGLPLTLGLGAPPDSPCHRAPPAAGRQVSAGWSAPEPAGRSAGRPAQPSSAESPRASLGTGCWRSPQTTCRYTKGGLTHMLPTCLLRVVHQLLVTGPWMAVGSDASQIGQMNPWSAGAGAAMGSFPRLVALLGCKLCAW